MTEIIKTNPATELEREIRNLRASILNGIDNRKRHPTYGYRKADLWTNLHRMEGPLYAWLLVTEGARSAAFGMQASDAAGYLGGIDLTGLRIAIKNS